MNFINILEQKILEGYTISHEEALSLIRLQGSELYRLFAAAAHIRDVRAGKQVDLCSIVNAKSGNCSENCCFCAQSAHYNTSVDEYDLLNEEDIITRAHDMETQGAKRFSIVISGRGINKNDLSRVLNIYKRLAKETNLRLCASLGIISEETAEKLLQAGVSVYHHNLETAESFFPRICTTHSYEERINTIKAAQAAGLDVCSGGIISMGESMEQRIEMAFTLRDLRVVSVPINILNPIMGTPLENAEVISPMEILKSIAIIRFILPDVFLRYAGGREHALRDLQAMGYLAGINASLVGSYLTTSGRTIEEDLKIITDLGLSY